MNVDDVAPSLTSTLGGVMWVSTSSLAQFGQPEFPGNLDRRRCEKFMNAGDVSEVNPTGSWREYSPALIKFPLPGPVP